jgi:Ser/Thr protein kinase RdoA (MazF antagonist)
VSSDDYYNLNPDVVLDAVEACGLQLDGSLLVLNSYENRVYRITDLDGVRWVVKFYRPNRWSDEQILEEHQFAQQLAELEIPVVAPVALKDNQTLVHQQGFRLALFPCKGGREPDLEHSEHLVQLGRYLGRIHAVGAEQAFKYRPAINVQTYGYDCQARIRESGYVPKELRPAYEAIVSQMLELVSDAFETYQPGWSIRLHADFHPGNILWADEGPHLVDLDDARMGPAIQDLWMLIGADPFQQCERLDDLLQGYEEFYSFPMQQVALIEPLRALRMLHYSAWLASRWEDPSFKHHFPWFAEVKYWEQQILQFKEQTSMLQDDTTKQRLLNYF